MRKPAFIIYEQQLHMSAIEAKERKFLHPYKIIIIFIYFFLGFATKQEGSSM